MEPMHPLNIEKDRLLILKKENPIAFGEELIRLGNNKTQSQIASMLEMNRNSINRYVKMGKWPDEIKRTVQDNREAINTTKLINWAKEINDMNELYEEVNGMISEKEAASLKIHPALGNFNELFARLEKIEERLKAFGEPSAVLNPGPQKEKEIPANLTADEPKAAVREPAKSLNQVPLADSSRDLDLTIECATSILIFVLAALAISLILKGTAEALGGGLEAWAKAILLEAGTIFMATLVKNRRSWAELALSLGLGGLSLFALHSGAENKASHSFVVAQENSSAVSELRSEREELQKSLSALPSDHLTKRKELLKDIRIVQEKLDQARNQAKLSPATDIVKTQFAVDASFRVATLLLSIFLVRTLVRKLRTLRKSQPFRAG